MGLEGESIGRVKFQPVPSRTERERSEIQRTQVKKCFPECSGCVPDVLGIRGLAKRRGTLFFLCPRPFRRSAFPAIRNVSFGEYHDKGECAEDW